jgi:hypothetical protein
MKRLLTGCLAFGLLAVIVVGISGCNSIHYQVTAHRDPFQTVVVRPSTFSFKSDPQSSDPVVEKQIQFYIMQSLTAKGWTFDEKGKGEYAILVNYSVEGKDMVVVKEITRYNKYTNRYETIRRPHNETEFRKVVRIFVSKRPRIGDVFWSVECSSTGSTDDVLLAAKYMVPYAVDRFPEEGAWENREDIKDDPSVQR